MRVGVIAASVLALCLAAESANAVTFSGPTTVPNVLAQESMDLNDLSATKTQNGIGTLNYNLNPGCAAFGATCFAKTTLNGPAGGPAVAVDIDQPSFSGAGGGDDNYAEMYYYVTYTGAAPVTIHMSDLLDTATSAARAQVYFGFGVANTNFSGPLSYGVGYAGDDGSLAGPLVYNLTDCAGGCIQGVGNDLGPLGNINNVNMVSGATYLVDIWAEVAPANSPASAELDPTFTAPSGHFTFSAGVANGVPEPSTWTVLLIGFAALGGALRARRGLSAPIA